jgi:hypothetical protein
MRYERHSDAALREWLRQLDVADPSVALPYNDAESFVPRRTPQLVQMPRDEMIRILKRAQYVPRDVPPCTTCGTAPVPTPISNAKRQIAQQLARETHRRWRASFSAHRKIVKTSAKQHKATRKAYYAKHLRPLLERVNKLQAQLVASDGDDNRRATELFENARLEYRRAYEAFTAQFGTLDETRNSLRQ